MNDQIKKIIAALKSVNLSNEEHERMSNALNEYMAHKPIKQASTPTQKNKEGFSLWVRLVPATLILAFIMTGNINISGSLQGVSVSSVDSYPTMTETAFDNENRAAKPKSISATSQTLDDSSTSLARDKSYRNEGVAAEYEYVETGNGIMPYPYEPPHNDISDTREFLKTHYSAKIKTRNVSDTVSMVSFNVSQVDGRIDGLHSSEKYGRISFVVPKANFFEFQSRIKESINSKLYIENISSTNLLYQKQNIENRTDNQTTYLDTLESRIALLNKNHIAIVASLDTEIQSLNSQIIAVKSSILSVDEDDIETLSLLEEQHAMLLKRISSKRAQLAKENRTYANENASLTNQIDRTEKNLDNLYKEDVSFASNVETVNGYIDVQWISIWKLAEAFSPTPLWLNGVVVVLLIWGLFEYKNRSRRLRVTFE